MDTGKDKADNAPKGLRYDTGKTRHDLLEPFAIDEVAKVFTKGALKYAPNNWLGGMKWSKVLACAKRHISKIEKGEDFDYDDNCKKCQEGTCTDHTGLYHAAHAAWNMLALISYYKYCPEYDDRLHHVLPKKKIGLDIDEVLADWLGHWCKRHNQPIPEFWNFDKDIVAKFEEVKNDKEFWMTIPAKISPKDLPFEPHCYITSRIIDKSITEEWLQKNGFPAVPVYSIGHNQSKVQVVKDSGIDWFVDDRYDNYIELNRAGICCWLMDAPHNQRYNVGYRRIKSLQDLIIT